MKNPITAIKEELNMTRHDLATIANCNSMTVYRLENGEPHTINAGILEALEQLGYNAEKVKSDYTAWKEQRGKALLKEKMAT